MEELACIVQEGHLVQDSASVWSASILDQHTLDYHPSPMELDLETSSSWVLSEDTEPLTLDGSSLSDQMT